ncbi:uncharacterized protein LOC142103578 [Mixophyes fleayi]|uniref:uncharacterized protein LOC142103578 n=1 Tax=Mixophyes fleayi TaxID=3061075 RepID=UPI003F4DD182
MAQERRSTRRTGGGPPLRVEYTSYEEELRQIMPREIVEGINVQDTDSPSFAQGVDSPGPQLSPIPTATPPPSVRDSATEEQAGPSSYQAPQVESLQMSPEPDEQTIITLETVDAPVSGFQDVAPGPAEAPAHQQPAPQSMDPAREMAQSIGLRQGSLTAGQYAVQFRTLAAELRWNDEALIATFWQGLNERIKDDLASRDLPSTLDDIISLYIKVDIRHRERACERDRTRRTFPRLAPNFIPPT